MKVLPIRISTEELSLYLEGSKSSADGHERDSQRQKIYDSEDALKEENPELLGKYFDDVPSMQEYIDAITETKWWKNRFNIKHIRLKDGRGRRSGTGYNINAWFGIIKMPKWFRWELYLLHELTHVVTYVKPQAGHGRLFTKVYLDLVKWQMGEETYQALRKRFKEHNVKWSKRSKRGYKNGI